MLSPFAHTIPPVSSPVPSTGDANRWPPQDLPELKAELEKLGRSDIMIVVGGVIPPSDVQPLIEMGAAAVYPPGSAIADTAVDLIEKLNQRLGYAQPAPVKEPAR